MRTRTLGPQIARFDPKTAVPEQRWHGDGAVTSRGSDKASSEIPARWHGGFGEFWCWVRDLYENVPEKGRFFFLIQCKLMVMLLLSPDGKRARFLYFLYYTVLVVLTHSFPAGSWEGWASLP